MTYRRLAWALAAALVAAAIPVAAYADPSVPPGQPVKCLTNSPEAGLSSPAICSTQAPTSRRGTAALCRSSSTRRMCRIGVAWGRGLESRPRALHRRRLPRVRQVPRARRARRARQRVRDRRALLRRRRPRVQRLLVRAPRRNGGVAPLPRLLILGHGWTWSVASLSR